MKPNIFLCRGTEASILYPTKFSHLWWKAYSGTSQTTQARPTIKKKLELDSLTPWITCSISFFTSCGILCSRYLVKQHSLMQCVSVLYYKSVTIILDQGYVIEDCNNYCSSMFSLSCKQYWQLLLCFGLHSLDLFKVPADCKWDWQFLNKISFIVYSDFPLLPFKI